MRSRNRLPRNLTNRKGSYLARRIAKNVAPSGSRHTRDWTLKEKAKLLKALQTVTDPDDYESVASHIVTRLVVTISEHKNFIYSAPYGSVRTQTVPFHVNKMNIPLFNIMACVDSRLFLRGQIE